MVGKNFKWFAMFSQTGSEVNAISSELGFSPDLILTNNRDRTWHPFINRCNVMSDTHDNLMKYLRIGIPDNIIITLHGYLRIIPEDIANKYEMYNGHPAPINIYPELKGKDKQEDLYYQCEKYDTIGCVVHRVTPVLDDGEIIVSVGAPNNLQSVDDAYLAVRPLSLESWKQFFNVYVPNRK